MLVSYCCGLNCIFPQKICWSPHPQHLWIWLYLKIVFSDGIKLGWTPAWLMWTLISYDWCPYKKRKDAETHRENHVMMGERMEWPICNPRNAKDCQRHQKLRERPGTLLLQNLQREHGPAATLISISRFQNSSFLCCDFKPPSLWNLVIAALENQCSFSLLLLENIVVVPVVNLGSQHYWWDPIPRHGLYCISINMESFLLWR